jgi:hypothetical protein
VFKKLLVLAAASAFSMSASAAYVQYNLTNVTYANGYKGLSGFFIQDTDTQGILFYSISGYTNFFIPGTDSTITHASITVPGGPTSFTTTSHNNGENNSTLILNFGQGATPNTYTVSGLEYATINFPVPPNYVNSIQSQILSGTAAIGPFAPGIEAYINSPNSGLTEFLPDNAPAQVPEPASLALVAAGLGRLGRMRKRARG